MVGGVVCGGSLRRDRGSRLADDGEGEKGGIRWTLRRALYEAGARTRDVTQAA